MKIRQTLYIEPDLILRVKHAALDGNKSISEWVKEAIQKKLWQEIKLVEIENKSLQSE